MSAGEAGEEGARVGAQELVVPRQHLEQPPLLLPRTSQAHENAASGLAPVSSPPPLLAADGLDEVAPVRRREEEASAPSLGEVAHHLVHEVLQLPN